MTTPVHEPAFAGKIVVVTGASRGLGRAIALAFVEQGAQVLGTATSEASFPLEAGGVTFIAADFSSSEGIEEAVRWIASLPRIDVLVNNAGINRIKRLDAVVDGDFSTVMDVNLRAPYRLSQAASQTMAANGGGHIINIASIWAVITKSQRSLYTTAKTGLVGLTRALAVELAPVNILVNAVSPGFVLTDLTRQSLSAEEILVLSAQVPLGRMAEPSEIARVVRFLCSTENTYLTGQNITIDGSFTNV